jgi:SAM-dependent methyltransferase
MRRKLLEIIVCPACRSAFELDSFATGPRSSDHPRDPEVLDGALRCTACGASYPVIGGVPRLLSTPLLDRMRGRYPEFFAAHPEFLRGRDDAGHELADTLESFTRQRLDLRPPGPEFARQWHENLARNLGPALPVEKLQDRLVLDVGCGFGRHMYVASEQGAEVVGIDLSGGVDRAYELTRRRPNCHVVQANIFDRPLRENAFDLVWSFGVLHHMPDPFAGFRAIVPFARPDGGRVLIWVYGYTGMALSYRLSHMRALHRRTRHLSGRARAALDGRRRGALRPLLGAAPSREAHRPRRGRRSLSTLGLRGPFVADADRGRARPAFDPDHAFPRSPRAQRLVPLRRARDDLRERHQPARLAGARTAGAVARVGSRRPRSELTRRLQFKGLQMIVLPVRAPRATRGAW